ncbi:hypothetical protein CEXT_401481 [Caerostris extrusa]|uniref:Uncharacterized protein n=1 Tax=Caerostris extrusa TaxID=172846 RepID=A0AAV4NML1_CAEEX|nr:hypothetical protein CEXT_401481 [Caerostris extrusa]
MAAHHRSSADRWRPTDRGSQGRQGALGSGAHECQDCFSLRPSSVPHPSSVRLGLFCSLVGTFFGDCFAGHLRIRRAAV